MLRGVDGQFDWKGCSAALTYVGVVALLVVGAKFGVAYATDTLYPSADASLAADAAGGDGSSSAGTHADAANSANTIGGNAGTTTPNPDTLSTTTPERVINALTIAQAVPATGKFIAADLVNMELYLYQDGTTTAAYPILSKGRPGTSWETPSGMYAVQSKEATHFSTIGHVYMPYSMQFYGNYFIHGWTYYPDGTPVAATFSGGCIKLATTDAEKVYAFADVGTKVFVYDSKQATPPPALSLASNPVPAIDAASYLVADIDTGDVYTSQFPDMPLPIASVTKLMTALVANEIISLDKKVTIEDGMLKTPRVASSTAPETFLVDDLFYPLLMQSNNAIADALASYYGTRGFVGWMNTTARALDMTSTTFADASGVSASNVSTSEDLFRLATYLENKKSFVLKITHTKSKTITASDGTSYTVYNVNAPATDAAFDGGKVGHTTAAEDTMLSVLSITVGGTERHIAIIVLGSTNQKVDTDHLATWITAAATAGATSQTACASCALPQYRKIQL